MAGVSASFPMMSDSPSGTTGGRNILLDSPAFDPAHLTPTSSAIASLSVLDCSVGRDVRGSQGPVPCWCLAR